MSTQTPPSVSSEEMDLTDVFELFRRWFYRLLAHVYRAIAFVFKYWWIFLLLIVAGIVLGYFTKGEPTYKASLILKTNFNSQSYVYNAVEQFNNNLKDNDIAFMKAQGLDIEDPGIYDITIAPVVDVIGLIDKIENGNRNLETVIGELEVEKDEELFSTDRFFSNYKYHKLEIELSPTTGPAGIEALMKFINDQPYIKSLSAEALKNHNDKIALLRGTIKQIDEVVEVYSKATDIANNNSSRLSFYNNPTSLDMRQIFEYKKDLQEEIETLSNDWVGSNRAAVIVSSIETATDESILDKKHIIYPILFVFLFSFLASIRYFYKRFRVKLLAEKLID